MWGRALFRDRRGAGRALARSLEAYRERSDVIVLGLPRGGVPVAFEVADALGAPLDVFVVRKLGLPEHPELAMGAIASGGVRVLNHPVILEAGVTAEQVETVAREEQAELERRLREYRGKHPPLDVRDLTVLLVDDGLATGSTLRAAIAALHELEPSWIAVAVPVGAKDTCLELRGEVDELVCAHEPAQFVAVGSFYEDFAQTSDAEVHALLERAAELRSRALD